MKFTIEELWVIYTALYEYRTSLWKSDPHFPIASDMITRIKEYIMKENK